MKFSVYYRRVYDGRAPEHVDLADYDPIGEFEADNIRRLESLLFNTPSPNSKFVGATRAVRVGDVVIESYPAPRARIYTMLGQWANVKLVK